MWTAGVLTLSPLLAFMVAAQESSEPLLQYGAVGILAAVAMLAARVMWNRLLDAIDRERARADRLEEQLRKQNELIQERFVVTLQESSRAIQEAMTVVRERRR